MATEMQIPLIYAGINGLLDKVPVNKIQAWEEAFKQELGSSSEGEKILAELGKGQMPKSLEESITSFVKNFTEGWLQK